MKHVKYTLPLLAIFLGLALVIGPSFSRCSVWEDLTGTGAKKDDSLAWLALLLALGQGGGGGTTGTDNLTVNDTVSANGPKYYTITAATSGFFDITLTKSSGTRPELYLTYLGDTSSPALGTCPASNWVACDTTTTNPITLSNHYIGGGSSRQVGLNITAAPVTYTLQATRKGSVPQGCAVAFENTSAMVNGSSASKTLTAVSTTSFYYVIVNNTGSTTTNAKITLNITLDAANNQDGYEIDVLNPDSCNPKPSTLLPDTTCRSIVGAPYKCSVTTSAFTIKAGDYNIVELKPYTGATGNSTITGNYTLSLSY